MIFWRGLSARTVLAAIEAVAARRAARPETPRTAAPRTATEPDSRPAKPALRDLD